MVFHMIRNEIGDRAFFGALRAICRERLYRSASWGDFERAFSRSSGRDLSSFFKQWLTRPGGPRLGSLESDSPPRGARWTVSGTVVQSPPLYELRLPLRLETDGPPVRELLTVTGGITPFRISSPTEPRHLFLDPDAEEFRVLAPGEIPVTVNSIKASKQLLVIMTEGCQASAETFRRLLESLGQGKAAVIRENELDAARLHGHDLLFCGIPKAKIAVAAASRGDHPSRYRVLRTRRRGACPGRSALPGAAVSRSSGAGCCPFSAALGGSGRTVRAENNTLRQIRFPRVYRWGDPAQGHHSAICRGE